MLWNVIVQKNGVSLIFFLLLSYLDSPSPLFSYGGFLTFVSFFFFWLAHIIASNYTPSFCLQNIPTEITNLMCSCLIIASRRGECSKCGVW